MSPMATARRSARRGRDFFGGAGSGTRALLVAVLVCTVVVIVAGQSLFGLPPGSEHLVPWLVVGPDTLPSLKLTALLTNTFVNPSRHPDALFMPLFLFAMLNLEWLQEALQTRLKALLLGVAGIIGVGIVLNALLPGAWGLVAGLLLVWFFGSRVEASDGRAHFLRFSLGVAGLTSLFGAALTWVAPGSVQALLDPSAASTSGISPLVGAWLALFSLSLRNVRLTVLHLDGSAFFWLLVALDVYTVLFQGAAAGLMGLFGLALAWRFMSAGRGPGGGRRVSLADRWRMWRLEQRRKRFKVLRGGPTLHRAAVGSST